MTKQHTQPKSKAMRNLHSAGKGIVRATGNTAAKGIEKTAKWMATDHTGSADDVRMMNSQQSISYLLAGSKLLLRTMLRNERRSDRRFNTDEEADNSEVVSGWLIDHLLYLWDLLWGFIWPILSYLFFSLLSVVLIILFNVIFFGALYLYFTS